MEASKEETILKELTAKFDVEGRIQRERRIWINVDRGNLIELCNFVKEMGFDHLSDISVTDWVKEGKYEDTYHLWSYQHKILLTIKTRIDRDNPIIKSIFPIWGKSAQIHEREMHEMFGVNFEENPDLSPLFLEDWQGPPPFRKDFDWRKYVRENYYDKNNEREKVYFEEV
ncbi:MAG: NADH-quinone oxidoreductase subunit C [Thermoplasmata archaeon]|nr:MAG: NADH-quinone oxidoreductase subunit C [Thermoplasmata archaeon]